MPDMEEETVCFRKTDDGRSIILPTKKIGKNPIEIRQKLVEQAEQYGYYSTSSSQNSTSLTPLPHMRNLGGGICIMNCHDDTVRIAASSPGKIPSVVPQIIQGAFFNARECPQGGVSS